MSLKNHPMPEGTSNYCNPDSDLINIDSNIKINRQFGNIPYKLGLPPGTDDVLFKNTFPDPFTQGAGLPRPYGQRDNIGMTSNVKRINQFGSRKRKSLRRKSLKRKSLKRKSRKRKNSKKNIKKYKCSKRKSKRRGFGNDTPGTDNWMNSATNRNDLSNFLSSTDKGYVGNAVQFYEGPLLSAKNNYIGAINYPAQFSNNQQNSPNYKGFGKKSFKRNKESNIRKSNRRRFGSSVVQKQQPMLLYNAGANTINYSTGKLYFQNIVDDIGKVQPDGITNNAWLSRSAGL